MGAQGRLDNARQGESRFDMLSLSRFDMLSWCGRPLTGRDAGGLR